jgi:molecular chaperone GrpE (heat shock protein)
MEERIAHLMKALSISREQAIQLLEDDKRIDKGEKLFELDPELEKGAKKARQADRKPTERKPREKKEDNDKQTIISKFLNAILPIVDSYEVANAEREFSFRYKGKKYKVVLSCPRS